MSDLGDREALREALEAIPDLASRFDEPAARHTRLRIGGPVDLWLVAETEDAASAAVRCCKERGIKIQSWPGADVLVRDGGMDGAWLELGAFARGVIVGPGGSLDVGALHPAAALAERAASLGLRGLEALAGRAGTVADAWQAGLLGEVLSSARILQGSRFSEREAAALKPNRVPVRLRLSLRAGQEASIREAYAMKIAARSGLGEGLPGRVMQDPPLRGASAAAEVIAEAGLCGVRLRGARIGLTEPNAVITERGVEARDVFHLIRMMKDRAMRASGIELEPLTKPVGRR